MASGGDKILVVVGVDEGSHSEAAFRKALRTFHKGAEYDIIYVRPEEKALPMEELYASKEHRKAVKNKRRAKAEEILDKYGRMAKNVGISYRTLELEGDPRKVLCDYCASNKADALVLGNRGAGPVKRLLLGSVSSYCVHHATCAVLVDRSTEDEEEPSGGEKARAAGTTIAGTVPEYKAEPVKGAGA